MRRTLGDWGTMDLFGRGNRIESKGGWEVWCRPDREGWLEGERAGRES